MSTADAEFTTLHPLIKNLDRLPLGKNEWFHHHADVEGFTLRVRRNPKTGKLTNGWYHGRRRAPRKLLGDARKVKEADALKVARERNARVDLGADLKREQTEQAAANSVTLLAMATGYVEYKKPPNLTEGSWKILHAYLLGPVPRKPGSRARPVPRQLSYLAPYHDEPAHKVGKTEVSKILRACEKQSGKPSAIQLKSAMSAMWSWGIKEGCYHVEVNPVSYACDIEDVLDEERNAAAERLLSEAELVKIWKGVDGDTEFGACVRWLILTLCRRKEIAKAQWSAFDDPENPTQWEIPFEDLKNRKGRRKKKLGTVVLPVTSLMREVLARVHPRHGTQRLFGSVRAGNGFQSYSDGKEELDAAIGIPKWRLHHIRRSASTHLGNMGVRPYVVDEILGHSSAGGGNRERDIDDRDETARRYNKSRYSMEVRGALQMWSDHMRELIAPLDAADGDALTESCRPATP
jgi:integrase